MTPQCRDCGRFVGWDRLQCVECLQRIEDEKAARARIDAMPMPPWCPWPHARCICGDAPL